MLEQTPKSASHWATPAADPFGSPISRPGVSCPPITTTSNGEMPISSPVEAPASELRFAGSMSLQTAPVLTMVGYAIRWRSPPPVTAGAAFTLISMWTSGSPPMRRPTNCLLFSMAAEILNHQNAAPVPLFLSETPPLDLFLLLLLLLIK